MADEAEKVDLNVKLENKLPSGIWRTIERFGFPTVLLVALAYQVMSQDKSRQDYQQTSAAADAQAVREQAAENAAAIKEQAKLDREKEKAQAAFIQERLISGLESQVAATVNATAATDRATEAQEEVATALNEFTGAATKIVERVDHLIEHVESAPAMKASVSK